MRYFNSLVVLLLLSTSVVTLTSCGKSAEEKEAEEATSLVETIARQAAGMVTVDEEAAAVNEIIEGAGYEVLSYEKFVSQDTGKLARMIVYADGKKSGGAIYATVQQAIVTPVWHWYFEDDVPEKVTYEELNDDGLWDIIMTTKQGKEHRFIQDESFTMIGGDQTYWIANNVSTSSAADASELLHCFDGSARTAWRSPVDGAFIEVKLPFGVSEGILTLRSAPEGQARSATVYADGKKVQDVQLASDTNRQMLQLDSAAVGAKVVRVEFGPTHGSEDFVGVAEIGVR